MVIQFTLDENTRDVLTTLFQVGGGFLTGVIVAMLGFRQARRLDRERWRREDHLRQAEAARVTHDRWVNERREVYGRFVAKLEDVRELALGGADSDVVTEALKTASRLEREIALIASKPVSDAAYAAWNAVASESRDAIRRRRGEDPGPAGEIVVDGIGTFMRTARDDLRPPQAVIQGRSPAQAGQTADQDEHR